MKGVMTRCWAWLGAMAILVGLSGAGVKATVIDFNGIPDGTLVSAGNPYAGIVYIQAESGVAQGPPEFMAIPWTEASVVGGVVVALPPDVGLVDSEGAAQGVYGSTVTANFLQPVRNVSFDGAVVRTAGYDYTAANGAGATLSASGVFGLPFDSEQNFHHVELPVPPGFHLTQLRILNLDSANFSAGIWVDNLAFDLAVVPEACGTLLLLGMSSLTLAGLRRRTQA